MCTSQSAASFHGAAKRSVPFVPGKSGLLLNVFSAPHPATEAERT